MFITTHAALGALAAEVFPTHPALAFVLGMATHFLADIIPHGDGGLYKGYISGSKVKRAVAYVVIDGVVAIFFILFLFNTQVFENRLAISMGIAGGVLPDLLVGVYEVTRVTGLRWFHRVHFFFHNLVSGRTGDLSFPAGFSMQLLFLALLMSRLG
jgi:xanthine/uracil permease